MKINESLDKENKAFLRVINYCCANPNLIPEELMSLILEFTEARNATILELKKLSKSFLKLDNNINR